jgi:hypothetical protein
MAKIRFRKAYTKLRRIHLEKPVQLLEVFIKDIQNAGQEFLDYDTEYEDGSGNFPLPDNGRHIVLLFSQEAQGGRNLFTTLRKFTPAKASYWFGLRGALIDVEITQDEH